MYSSHIKQAPGGTLVFILSCIIAVGSLSGCELFSFQSDATSKKPAPISEEWKQKRLFIPIIYSDRVVELDTRTGRERAIPDEDLIVENGKVWGRYIRLGNDVKYTMSYRNHLCAPVSATDIETIGETSRPARTFAVPTQKYDDCKEEDLKKAARRVQDFQSEYDALKIDPEIFELPK